MVSTEDANTELPPGLYYAGELNDELERRYASELMMGYYGSAYTKVQAFLKILGACPQITLMPKGTYKSERIALETLSFGEINGLTSKVELSAGLPSPIEYLPMGVQLKTKRPVNKRFQEQVEETRNVCLKLEHLACDIATIWRKKLAENGLSISLDYNELSENCELYRNLQKHGRMIGIDRDIQALLAGVPLEDILA